MEETRRIAPEISPSVEPIPVQRRMDEPLRALAPPTAPPTDWLAAGWKFGLGFMAAVTVFSVLDGLVVYIVSTQGFHLNLNLAH